MPTVTVAEGPPIAEVQLLTGVKSILSSQVRLERQISTMAGHMHKLMAEMVMIRTGIHDRKITGSFPLVGASMNTYETTPQSMSMTPMMTGQVETRMFGRPGEVTPPPLSSGGEFDVEDDDDALSIGIHSPSTHPGERDRSLPRLPHEVDMALGGASGISHTRSGRERARTGLDSSQPSSSQETQRRQSLSRIVDRTVRHSVASNSSTLHSRDVAGSVSSFGRAGSYRSGREREGMSSSRRGSYGRSGSLEKVVSAAVLSLASKRSPRSSMRSGSKVGSRLSNRFRTSWFSDNTNSFDTANGKPQAPHGAMKLPKWPADIRIRHPLVVGEGARASNSESQNIVRQLWRSGSLVPHPVSTTMSTTSLGEHKKKGKYRILDPDSRTVITFDILSFFIVLHDLLITPYVLVMDIQSGGTLNTLAWIATSFWSVEFVLGFFTGFYQRGEVNLNPKAVVFKYMKTWCFPNLFILVCDWTHITLQELQATGKHQTENTLFQIRVVRILKVFRLMKVFRLARLIRLADKLSAWCSVSRATRTVFQVIRIVFGVLIYSHFVSCTWIFIGRQQVTEDEHTWLDYPTTSARQSEALADASNAQQYITAFHWTLAQMTPGPIDIVAGTFLEKVFNTVLLLVGLLLTSMIVSLISGQIVQLIITQRERTQKLDALEKFLRQTKIKKRLAVRVQRQALDRLGEEPEVTEHHLEALKCLSSGLRFELLYEVRKAHLLAHPLFRMWEQLDIPNFYVFCEEAVSFEYLTREDDLFHVGEEALGAYYVVTGRLLYSNCENADMVHNLVRSNMSSATSNGVANSPSGRLPTEWQATQTSGPPSPVCPGAWVAEAALWSHWLHVGRLEASTPSKILRVSATRMLEVAERRSAVAYAVKRYGRNFHLRLISAVPPLAPLPTDLHVPFTDAGDLQSPHVGIGLYRRALAEGLISMTTEQRRSLEKELREEKCTLKESPNGLVRVVLSIVLRLARNDGRVLAQLAEGAMADSEGGLEARVMLPSADRGMSELPQKALQRLLNLDLAMFSRGICVESWEHEAVEVDTTIEYGLQTSDLRVVHHAVLDQTFEVPELDILATRPSDVSAPFGNREEAFLIQRHDRKVLYGWLTPDELLQLKEPANLIQLQTWLSAVGEYSPRIHMPEASSPQASPRSRRDSLSPTNVLLRHEDVDADFSLRETGMNSDEMDTSKRVGVMETSRDSFTFIG